MYLIKNILPLLLLFASEILSAQITVTSLSELQAVVQNSNQQITMQPGYYNLEDDLPSASRYIDCSGSNNSIDLTGVYIEVPVGSVTSGWFEITGDDNTMIGGEIEDTYRSGITEITDFSAYNQDRANLAIGLGGDAVVTIRGSDNLLDGLKLTTRGSFPYGYGSIYGIGAGNTFGLNKRCGILISAGDRNTIDNVEVQSRAFCHGIFIQSGSDGTVVKNSLVEGRMRPYFEMYDETNSFDLPFLSDYLMPHSNNAPIPTVGKTTLCEDGIRAYNGIGSVTVENCTVKKMRGGIRLYLASSATVSNSTAIDCGDTNFNMPSGGVITNSSGNFTYSTLNDNRLSRSNQNIDISIIPSPEAEGPHNIADVLGNNQQIIFRRTPGPLDSDEERVIYISGDNSNIVNETEYAILLDSSASGNTITTCGPVTDNGTNNTISTLTDCTFSESIANNVVIQEDEPGFCSVDGTIDNNHEGFSGTGFANTSNQVGNTINWEIDGGSGAYTFEWRYANGGSANRQGDLIVNGVTVLSGIDFNHTGGWSVWDTTIGSTINLQAGVKTIQLQAIGNSGLANIDYMEVNAPCVTSSTCGVSTPSTIVHIRKRNASDYALDGGSADGQNLQLWSQNPDNLNQQWIEIDRGYGYYSYEKRGTNQCIDGGEGGSINQNVSLGQCDCSNLNQYWKKEAVDGGFFKLVKRDVPYALDGGSGGFDGRNVELWEDVIHQNLQWSIEEWVEDCQIELNLTGTEGINVILDYTAQNIIRSTQVLETGATAMYDAGEIELEPDFNVELGAVLTTYLEGCEE